MKAAVVASFDSPPRYGDFTPPSPEVDEVLVLTKAAALSQLVRAQAAGKHPSAQNPPLVPGTDGVGLLDGRRVYFGFPRPPVGSMAEEVAVKRSQCVELPADVDDVTAAAAANPGMSSWAGLTRRARFVRGEAVLVNGAAGASGRLAIQVAKHLGARRVVATARNPAVAGELAALGADAFISLEQPRPALIEAFRNAVKGEGVDVVLDYVYGNAAEAFIHACIGPARGAGEPRIRFVQLGSLAGPAITLPAQGLRGSGLELIGSGLGSLSHRELVTCIGEFFQSYRAGGFEIHAESAPLSSVETAWTKSTRARLVFTL